MTIQNLTRQLVAGHDLSSQQMQDAMRWMMSGETSDAQTAAFLVALNIKGETVQEITEAARLMRQMATTISIPGQLVDPVGTGGDGAKLFNVSTCCALVASAAGLKVAKHGNRAATSSSGSADLLEAAGVRLDLNAEQISKCVEQHGIGFLFAPMHHSAMRHVIGPRKEIGVRTVFNVLGPLTNPVDPQNQLLGVYRTELVEPIAKVCRELGREHVLVTCSDDGLDEISIVTTTQVAELKDGEINTYTIDPAELGLQHDSLSSLIVEDAVGSLALIRSVLNGEKGAAYDMVALNAGATLYAGNHASDLKTGIEQAKAILDSGSAWKKLEALASFSQSL